MKRMIEDSVLTGIANAIREKNGSEDTYQDVEMEQAIRDIQAGDSWYDTFWDVYQRNNNNVAGLRTNYDYAFGNYGWNSDNFKPKYDIKPKSADHMFQQIAINDDLVEILEQQGVILDFSECTNFSWAFYGSRFTRIGVVDMRKVSSASNANNVFRTTTSWLHTIDKLIVSETYPIGTSSFANCTKLANITIEGFITGNFNISVSPLTTESMKSVIKHLKDYNGTTNAFKYTVSFLATSWEALDAEGTTVEANGKTWREYINDLGWNVG